LAKNAITRVEQKKSILVTVPTGFGKSQVALAAMFKCLNEDLKLVYICPTKALANQMFLIALSNFHSKFESKVGISTGDKKINNSHCNVLITVPQTLKLKLITGAITLDFVIFDELHTINNPNNGHVWEFIIRSMSQTVCCVGLSATLPNVEKIKKWTKKIIPGWSEEGNHISLPFSERPVKQDLYVYGRKLSKLHDIALSDNIELPISDERKQETSDLESRLEKAVFFCCPARNY